MEENAKMIESLVERTTEYGKTSIALFKLRALEKTSDIVSTALPYAVVLLLVTAFLLFLSLGMAFLLGDLFGNINLGFFAIALVYALLGVIFKLFLFGRLKAYLSNLIIRLLLN